jgi:hypothetical protein
MNYIDKSRPTTLLIAEGDQRVDANGAPRWDVTREQSDPDEEKSDARKRQRIGRPDAVKQAGH